MPVRTGTSLMALTATLRLSDRLLTPPLLVPPASVTVQLMLPLPLASATVLYFRPCHSVSDSVAPVVTEVLPLAFHKLMKSGMAVMV